VGNVYCGHELIRGKLLGLQSLIELQSIDMSCR
jgi:hypothetical protein